MTDSFSVTTVGVTSLSHPADVMAAASDAVTCTCSRNDQIRFASQFWRSMGMISPGVTVRAVVKRRVTSAQLATFHQAFT
jgi:hypothetical protein